jgi:threonine/homoserine/homoserine lactone efflux protein
MVFFVAFVPPLINQAENVTLQLWFLASTFVILATLNATCYAVFDGRAQHFLASAKTQRFFYIGGGSLMCGADVWAITSKWADLSRHRLLVNCTAGH